MSKPVKISVVHQGGPIVNAGWIYSEGGSVAAIEIDMSSKYCQVDAIMGGQFPGILVGISERSLGLTKGKEDASTVLEFPEYAGWRVWCADLGRYTLAVCLVKDNVEAKDE